MEHQPISNMDDILDIRDNNIDLFNDCILAGRTGGCRFMNFRMDRQHCIVVPYEHPGFLTYCLPERT